MTIPDDTANPSDCRVAWAAGFFDGEGSVSLIWSKRSANKNSWWRVQVVLTNCDRRALEHFVQAVGEGRIYSKRPIEGRRQVHYLLAADGVADRILRRIAPYLVSKADVVRMALEARGLGQRKPFERIPEGRWLRLIEIENEIKTLNGRNYRKVTVENRMRLSPIVDHCQTSK